MQLWAQEALAGALADVYTFAAGGAVTLGLTSALVAGDSLATAMSAFAAADVAFVGAVSLIAGAVSAISAAVARPRLVKAVVELIATAQTLWLLFPSARRGEGAQVCFLKSRRIFRHVCLTSASPSFTEDEMREQNVTLLHCCK
jgi:hypothetical protein